MPRPPFTLFSIALLANTVLRKLNKYFYVTQDFPSKPFKKIYQNKTI